MNGPWSSFGRKAFSMRAPRRNRLLRDMGDAPPPVPRYSRRTIQLARGGALLYVLRKVCRGELLRPDDVARLEFHGLLDRLLQRMRMASTRGRS
jgi:hypothetical protein